MTQPTESEYDAIAGAYKDSKQLSFRKYIEEYTLFETLGDITGVKALDLACGEGFYTRKLKLAGAAEVLRVEVFGRNDPVGRGRGTRAHRGLPISEPGRGGAGPGRACLSRRGHVPAELRLRHERTPSLCPVGARRAETGRAVRGFQRQRPERPQWHGLIRPILIRKGVHRDAGRRRSDCLPIHKRRRHAVRVQQLLSLAGNLSPDLRGTQF